MNRALFFSFLLTLMSAAMVSAESAGHGHDGDFSIGDLFHQVDFWGSVVNFVLLIALFYFGARKPIKNFLEKRREVLETEIDAARAVKEKAEAQYKELTERLEKFEQESEELKARIRKSGEEERDQIISDAKAKALRIEQDADFMMEQKVKELKSTLKNEIVEEAFAQALVEIEKSMDSSSQEKLANRFLEKLKQETARERAV